MMPGIPAAREGVRTASGGFDPESLEAPLGG